MVRYLIYKLSQCKLVGYRLRQSLLNLLGLSVFGKVYLKHGIRFSNLDLSTVHLGDEVFVNEGCYFDNEGDIYIGDRTAIAMNVNFVTTTHRLGKSYKRVQGEVVRKPITIGDGCWICTSTTILPGTVVGSGSVVVAGSVVKGHVAANSLYSSDKIIPLTNHQEV